MNNFVCDICNLDFKSKFGLEKHKNKKNKCNVVTKFQCDKCTKYFKSKQTLENHSEKCNKEIVLTNYNEDDYNDGFIESPQETNSDEDMLKSILNSSMTNDMKIQLIATYNPVLGADKILAILNSDMPLHDKIITFTKIGKPVANETTINNINNGTINNSTTNNIQINNFGNEKIEYLDNEYFKDLIMNNHIQTAYMKLIEDTYLHKDHPENRTIKIDNLNNKFGFVFENGKWRPILKYELKEFMHEKNNKLLKIHYKKVREFLDTAKKSSINVFFSRQYDSDPHLKLMNDQMVLLFYEGKNKNII
jgi:hypothetical protein